MNNLPNAVLSIYIPNQGFAPQGKICRIDEKWHFIANMTDKKLWRNYNGYSIAKRILDSLPYGTKIVYKRVDLNFYYSTNKSTFEKKGILVPYGSHRQWVLPLKNWEAHSGQFEEPHNLAVMNVDKWLRAGKTREVSPPTETERERFYQWYGGA